MTPAGVLVREVKSLGGGFEGVRCQKGGEPAWHHRASGGQHGPFTVLTWPGLHLCLDVCSIRGLDAKTTTLYDPAVPHDASFVARRIAFSH